VITTLGSPTEQTFLVAVKKRWRHLYALMCFDAIEFLFVA
jgi:hypothetical protein